MKKKIAFLVFPRTHLLDLAGPLQVFQEANDHGANTEIVFCSFVEHLSTSIDFPVGRLLPFETVGLNEGDYLIVPGAEVEWLLTNKVNYSMALINWVTDAHARGVTLVSICTGAFFLGSLGLLNGRACTTHWKHTERLKKTFPKIQLVENVLFTEDAGIFTSAGVTAGIDLALYLVTKLCGERVAFIVARELVVYLRRAPHESQQSVYVQHRNHVNYTIHKVQDYVQDQLHKGASLPVLSDVACMSPRNLTRTFKKETGITINAYLTLIRLEKLKELSKNTDYTRKQMARYCGLKSERQVIRLLKEL